MSSYLTISVDQSMDQYLNRNVEQITAMFWGCEHEQVEMTTWKIPERVTGLELEKSFVENKCRLNELI